MNTILVLTDFSEEAANAARFAVAVAGKLSAHKIILYHPFALSVTASPTDASSYEVATEDTNAHLIALKNELIYSFPGHIQIETCSDNRPLAEAIDALQEQVDLIVIGATVKGDLEEDLFGGNTMTVVSHCAKPLLVVPKDVRYHLIKNVLLACDLKEVLQTVPVQFIKSFTNALDAKLFILNVDYKEKHFRAETILEQTDLHKVFDNENAEFHYIDSENTANGILTFAAAHEIQLLITVRKERGLLGEIFHKSVSKKLIFDTGIPLLVLKETD
ncbi:universal stress protein [Rubrolithibacter danxiaensis]|uniref:universal stress protein n=1 Tax=Rubrolithibacter danxiaensis TaxID=3390805 RepID=UPI003BF8FB04